MPPPVPGNDAEAWLWLDTIDREGAPPGGLPPLLRHLHDTLVSRFPCICDLDDDSGVWSDGPLLNNFAPAIIPLGLIFSQAEAALPFIIEKSNALGFALFDP